MRSCQPATARRSITARQPARPTRQTAPGSRRRHSRSTRASPASYSSRSSSSARRVARLTRSVMPMPWWRRACSASRSIDASPLVDRRPPEPVAGGHEPDAGVGGVDRRVETADEDAHAGSDRVGQRPRPDGVDESRSVAGEHHVLEPGADEDVGEVLVGPAPEVPPGQVVVGDDMVVLTGEEGRDDRAPTGRAAVQVGEGQRQLRRGGGGGSCCGPRPRPPNLDGTEGGPGRRGPVVGRPVRAWSSIPSDASRPTAPSPRASRYAPVPQPEVDAPARLRRQTTLAPGRRTAVGGWRRRPRGRRRRPRPWPGRRSRPAEQVELLGAGDDLGQRRPDPPTPGSPFGHLDLLDGDRPGPAPGVAEVDRAVGLAGP